MPGKESNPAKEVAEIKKDNAALADKMNSNNRRLVRLGAEPTVLEKTKNYVPVPEDVGAAGEKVLADGKDLNMNGWIRAVMIETKGVHSEAELKEFLQTLIDDAVITSTPGKGREKILALKA